MLGVGIVLLTLTLVGFFQGVAGLNLSDRIESAIKTSIIIGIIIMFIFPHVMDYAVVQKMKNRNYDECEELSYRWLMYKKSVFSATAAECHHLVWQRSKSKNS